jgi:GST-like protein
MIDLYSVPTANGQRVHIILEETGLPYEPHFVNLRGGEHLEESFLDKNPFGRVPAIVDNDGPNGEPISIFEGHAILAYLAEKSGQLYPDDLGVRTQINIWMSAVSANLAPAFAAQFWFTTLAPERSDMAIERYISEAHRGLRALDLLFSNQDYIAGSEYTIADIHAYPVAATSGARLDGALTPYPNIRRWSETISKREAVKRGMALFTDAG